MGEIFKLFGTIGVDNSKANKALGETESKGQSVAGKLMSSFVSAASKIGKVMAVTATGIATSLAGIAIKKGWDRLIGIDDARAKLLGLGHDAKSVEVIMQSALDSVKGTSFGMDEAATTAANAVAAGIKPGKDLTKYLRTTADAAAIAGVSMSDMGSIINKVQTGQTAYTENLEQLSDRGLPIYQWLGKEAGVAASEVKEMASNGEISSEMFMNAIEKNIGGAAAIMGEASFSASLKNTWAALGRIGANFLDAGGKGGGFFSQIKPLVPQLTAALGGLEEKSAGFGVIFGQVFSSGIDFVLNFGNTLNSFAQSGFFKNLQWSFGFVSAAIKNMIDIVLNQLPGFQSTFSNIFNSIQTILTDVGGIIGGWATTVAMVFQYAVPIAIEVFKIAFETISSIVMPILETLISTFRDISSIVTEAIINNVVPALQTFLTALQENKTLIDGIKTVIVAAGTAFLTYKGIMLGIKVAQEAYNAVMFATTLMTKGLDAATVAMAGAQGASTLAFKLNVVAVKAATFAQKAFNLVMNANPIALVVTAIMALVAAFVYLWNTNEDFRNKVIEIWNTIKNKATEIFQAVADFLSGVWDSISSAVSSFIDSVVSAWEGFKTKTSEVFQGIADFISGVWDSIKNIAQTVWNVIFAVVGGIITSYIAIWKGIFEGFKIYLGLLWDGIKAVAMFVWSAIGDSVMAVVNSFISFVTTAFELWKTGIEIIFNGIKTVVTTVWNSISTAVMAVINFFVGMAVTIFNGWKNTITIVFNAIRTAVTTVWNAIKTAIMAVVNFIVNTATNLFNTWKNNITNIFNAIRNVASNIWESIKSAVTSKINALVSSATNIFNSLKNIVSSVWGSIRSFIDNTVNAVSNTVSNIWGSLKGIVSGIFNNVKSSIEGPMNSAKGLVEKAINAIKGFFSFEFKWPKLPMPHFSVNPSGWEIGDLLKGKIPTLGIDWYANGGVFDKPTLFPGSGGRLSGVGEAGAEAVAPLDTLIGYVETAVRGVFNEQQSNGDIIVTQNITSPEPLTPREIARETKLRLQDLATLR